VVRRELQRGEHHLLHKLLLARVVLYLVLGGKVFFVVQDKVLWVDVALLNKLRLSSGLDTSVQKKHAR